MKSCRRGFTLLEILIVVAIISILTAIVLVMLNQGKERANLAKARVEMQQIMNAAALVYSTYGYYPSDSHGSITCPKDIVIDQTSGTKWGIFIELCNDPFGNPYEWNNLCTDGVTTRKANGANPTCPPFTDNAPGPVGITMAGKNKLNDGVQ